MATIDLDEARAARLEASGEQTTIVFGGKSFVVPTEFTLETAQVLQTNDLEKALVSWMGKDVAKSFLALRPSVQDLSALIEQATKLQASAGSEEREGTS